jgi:hypothetical protein
MPNHTLQKVVSNANGARASAFIGSGIGLETKESTSLMTQAQHHVMLWTTINTLCSHTHTHTCTATQLRNDLRDLMEQADKEAGKTKCNLPPSRPSSRPFVSLFMIFNSQRLHMTRAQSAITRWPSLASETDMCALSLWTEVVCGRSWRPSSSKGFSTRSLVPSARLRLQMVCAEVKPHTSHVVLWPGNRSA